MGLFLVVRALFVLIIYLATKIQMLRNLLSIKEITADTSSSFVYPGEMNRECHPYPSIQQLSALTSLHFKLAKGRKSC